jgi:hypothetical protein
MFGNFRERRGPWGWALARSCQRKLRFSLGLRHRLPLLIGLQFQACENVHRHFALPTTDTPGGEAAAPGKNSVTFR